MSGLAKSIIILILLATLSQFVEYYDSELLTWCQLFLFILLLLNIAVKLKTINIKKSQLYLILVFLMLITFHVLIVYKYLVDISVKPPSYKLVPIAAFAASEVSACTCDVDNLIYIKEYRI